MLSEFHFKTSKPDWLELSEVRKADAEIRAFIIFRFVAIELYSDLLQLNMHNGVAALEGNQAP